MWLLTQINSWVCDQCHFFPPSKYLERSTSALFAFVAVGNSAVMFP